MEGGCSFLCRVRRLSGSEQNNGVIKLKFLGCSLFSTNSNNKGRYREKPKIRIAVYSFKKIELTILYGIKNK